MECRFSLTPSPLLVLFACLSVPSALEAGEAVFPLRAAPDGRYFVDSAGRPFFYHADTGWTVTKKLVPKEVDEYLDDRRARGFTAIHVHTFSKEQGPLANRDGQAPFEPPDDILKPNERYWQNVDSILRAARSRNLLVAMAAIWIRWGGKDREGWRYQLTPDNARPYGRFLGTRYREFQNLIWILGGDANPIERSSAIAEIALGIQESAPHQLISVHNRPENSSASFFGSQQWLGVNMAYTYGETYIHVLGEWNRLGKVWPIVLGESGYEEESNDGRGGEPFRVRRQAYGAILSGALGGHAFGQKHIWRFDEKWRGALDSPATRHIAHVKKLFASRPWYRLIPDQESELVIDGRGFFGDVDYVPAARTADGGLAIVYVPQARPVAVDLGRLRGPLRAEWFDPTTGEIVEVEGAPFEAAGPRKFAPPPKNAAGDTDFALVLEGR